jgi:aminoglycoside phosphotransferase (APT) family kinase protein
MPLRERARQMAEQLGVATDDPRPLGEGTAHHTFVVGCYVLRLVAELGPSTAAELARDAALLDRLQTRLPVAVPRPTLIRPELGAMAYRLLPGRPLLDVRLRSRVRLVDDLAALLRTMADLDPAALGGLVAPDPYPLDAWRDEVVEDVLARRDELTEQELGYIYAFARSPAPRPPKRDVFCHNDLGAEHLLVDEASGHLLGVLDWSDAALTDPCRDLGRLTRDLGASAVDRIIATAELEAATIDQGRIEFHSRLATLEDLSHGISTGDARYLEAARERLGPLFWTLT